VVLSSNDPIAQQQQVLLHPFNGLFSQTTWVSWYQKSKTSLDLNEARYGGVLGCSSISWTICKQCAPRFRQITTPTPRHSVFTGRMLFLTSNQQCQSTEGNDPVPQARMQEYNKVQSNCSQISSMSPENKISIQIVAFCQCDCLI